jgi:FKBP-type peptidyl-prolyl cis-trans isomerase FklB
MILLLSMGAVVSCSESDDEEASAEFANWQARNDAFFLTLEDSLNADPSNWRKVKTYTKDEKSPGEVTDYVYMKVLNAGDPYAEYPLFSDTVRISYRGRLIPTTNYPEGYVFDQTFAGTFSWETTSTITGPASGFVEGFTTALLHMHTGDRWRIYIPHQLGYGTTDKTSIPAYSTLVFDLALVDFRHQGQKLPTWNARRAQ